MTLKILLQLKAEGKKRNYIGANTLMEMAVAFEHNKRIFILNKLSKNKSNYEELISMSPICLNGDLDRIR